MNTIAPKPSFKEQMHQAREAAVLQATCQLLGEKTFDAMTMDDVAQAVGIAKASLYKHFASKEELCSAAMVQMLHRVQDYLASLPPDAPPERNLKAVVRWAIERLMARDMPLLPSRNSTLRTVLMGHKAYMNGLIAVSDHLGQWIVQAQASGAISSATPPLVVLYTLFARACDPVVGFLQESGQFSDEQVVELVVQTCFDGLSGR